MTLKFMGIDLSSEAGFNMAKAHVLEHIKGYPEYGTDPEFKKYSMMLGDDVMHRSHELVDHAKRGIRVNERDMKSLEFAERIHAMSTATSISSAAFRDANILKGRSSDGRLKSSYTESVKREGNVQSSEAPRERVTLHATFMPG